MQRWWLEIIGSLLLLRSCLEAPSIWLWANHYFARSALKYFRQIRQGHMLKTSIINTDFDPFSYSCPKYWPTHPIFFLSTTGMNVKRLKISFFHSYRSSRALNTTAWPAAYIQSTLSLFYHLLESKILASMKCIVRWNENYSSFNQQAFYIKPLYNAARAHASEVTIPIDPHSRCFIFTRQLLLCQWIYLHLW